MKTLQEAERIVENKKGHLYRMLIGKLAKNTDENGNQKNFIPMRRYYLVASWMKMNKRDAREVLTELKSMKIIIIKRHGNNPGITLNMVIE